MEPDELMKRALAAIGGGHMHEAAIALDAVLHHNPSHREGLLMRAMASAAVGDGPDAIERLDQLKCLSPDICQSAQYMSVRAHAMLALGDYRAAVAHFANVFQRDAAYFERVAVNFVRDATGDQRHLLYRAPPSLFGGERAAKQVFTRIYEEGLWGEGSGPGSHPSNAAFYAGFVQYLILHLHVQRVIDLGCGDWQFSQFIDFSAVDYTGVDIVEPLISQNTARYGADNVRFVAADVSDYAISETDLVLCKDVLQHLDDDSVLRVLSKLPNSGAWLITNDYAASNEPGGIGDARPLNPTAPPFSIAARPVLTFDDKAAYLALRNEGSAIQFS